MDQENLKISKLLSLAKSICGNPNIHLCSKHLCKEFEGSIRSVIHNSFCHIEESVRSFACDLLGAALLGYQDQNPVVYDDLKNSLPKLDGSNKVRKWVEKTLIDLKL